MKQRIAVLLCLFVGSVGDLAAQGATYNYKYDDVLVKQTEIQALKDDLFGDSTSYVDGGVVFKVTDVSVPNGTGPAVAFSRRLYPPRSIEGGNLVGSGSLVHETLGRYWKADVPRIVGTYPSDSEFVKTGLARCSLGRVVPNPVRTYPYNSLESIVFAYNFWHGLLLGLPEGEEEKILTMNPSARKPSDGMTYLYQTLSGNRVACLKNVRNASGEGFMVLTPSGTKYYFDWMAVRQERGLRVPDGSVVGSTTIGRTEVAFFATKVQDRFGNEVVYTYDVSNPHRVTSISSSTGARIQISYDSSGRVGKVEAGGRTWLYSYSQDPNWPVTAWLGRVQQPDGTAWAYAYDSYLFATNDDFYRFGEKCDFSPRSMTTDGAAPLASFRVTHPSGAIGQFKFKAIVHGTNNVPNGSCDMVAGSTAIYRLMSGRPKASPLNTLVEKSISGPGIQPLVWKLRYEPSWSYVHECTAGCPSTSRTTLSRNDGYKEIYEFGNDFQRNANQLLKRSVSGLATGSVVETYAYVTSPAGFPFSDFAAGPDGEELANSLDNPFTRKNRPQSSRVLEQDGSKFVRTVRKYDHFARPVEIAASREY